MKFKSEKLQKLEKNRFSIFTTDLEKCYICKMPKDDLHEIFNGCRSQMSIKFGLVIPVCRTCHSRLTNDEKLKLQYQAEIDEVHLVLRYFVQSKVDEKFKNGIIDMLFKYAGYDYVSAESTNEILAKKENERIAGAYTIKFLISDMLYKIEKTH